MDRFPTTITARLQINGKAVSVTHEVTLTLLDLLREELALTGTKRNCDHGAFGQRGCSRSRRRLRRGSRQVPSFGHKGIGEVGIVGVSAAIANAVFHATGRRVRSLPIAIDKLL